MVDAEFAVLLAAAVHGLFSSAADAGGGAALPELKRCRGSGGPEHSHRTEPATGGPYYEEVLMREQTSSGGHEANYCPQIITTTPESATPPC